MEVQRWSITTNSHAEATPSHGIARRSTISLSEQLPTDNHRLDEILNLPFGDSDPESPATARALRTVADTLLAALTGKPEASRAPDYAYMKVLKNLQSCAETFDRSMPKVTEAARAIVPSSVPPRQSSTSPRSSRFSTGS